MDVEFDTMGAEAWDADVGAAGGGFAQSFGYGAVAARHGAGVCRAVIHEGGRPIGYAQVLVRRFGLRVAVAAGAPVWAAHDDVPPYGIRKAGTAALRRAMRAHARVQIATPAAPQAFGLPLITPTHVARWHLGKGQAGLCAGLHGKWRNRLLRAQEAGLQVRKGGAAELNRLLQAEAGQRRARRYRGLPVSFLHDWCAGPRHWTLLEAYYGGSDPLAAILIARHGAGATYLVGHTKQAGRAVSAHTLLIWQAAVMLDQAGARYLDLGPIQTETGAGLARFKLGTGAQVLRTGATQLAF